MSQRWHEHQLAQTPDDRGHTEQERCDPDEAQRDTAELGQARTPAWWMGADLRQLASAPPASRRKPGHDSKPDDADAHPRRSVRGKADDGQGPCEELYRGQSNGATA